ncbi:MAG: FGGY family carbohydrate kinase [Sphingomonadaceae bacterium]
MAEQSILVIDEGTTSTRAMLFSPQGRPLGAAQREIAQHYPEPGRVEHDAGEIWRSSLACAREMVDKAGGPERIAGIGITNQRETIVFWHARTGEALAPAIVWLDRRTADLCRNLKAEGHEELVQERSGLLIDPYFSGSKIAWAMANWPQLAEAGSDLRMGTIESWLVHKLTGGLHVSDATNAARTLLMDIDSGGWDQELLDLFGAPRAALPEIVDCAGDFGATAPELFGAPIPIRGMAGDQQAASIGQACFTPGDSKATYGTGAFILALTGEERGHSKSRLLSTVAWQLGGERCYALEGSIFVAGSLVQWLRDSLKLIDDAAESEALARSVEDNGGVVLVPALSGLGAPHWEPKARAAITGLSFHSGKAHVVRAGLEAMAHQTRDLMAAFAADGAPWRTIKLDGGMTRNDWMCQDIANICALPAERPEFIETTALGAAMLAGLGCGHHDSLEETAKMRGPVTRFEPEMEDAARERRLGDWREALAAVLAARNDL